jgi:hypothetical protein
MRTLSLVFAVALVVACQKAKVEPDQVKSFKELVTRFPTRSIGAEGTKEAYDIVITDVTFDVKKTDSLMNPVVGTINFTTSDIHEYSPGYQITGIAEKRYSVTNSMQMVFHWQGDHWKFERIWNRENGVDFTGGEQWGGPMSDFLKSVQ